MKNIYHYDSDGVFLGVSEADESPLEPGVYLIPSFATEIEPPEFGEGFRAVFANGEWKVEPIPVPPEPEPTPEPTEDELKNRCKAEARSRLIETDYTELPSVRAILVNGAEFDAYRTAVRALVINPVTNPTFPERVSAVWA
jgi:hypothetical protein